MDLGDITMAKKNSMTIGEALKYPFNRFAGIWNIFWALIPIIGNFLVAGYFKRIVQHALKGRNKELPLFEDYNENLVDGFFLTLATTLLLFINFASAAMLIWIPILGWLAIPLLFMMVPLQLMQYMESGKFVDALNYQKTVKMVFTNFGDFLITALKNLVVICVWILASIPVVTMVVTLPAMKFGAFALIADFYKRNRK